MSRKNIKNISPFFTCFLLHWNLRSTLACTSSTNSQARREHRDMRSMIIFGMGISSSTWCASMTLGTTVHAVALSTSFKAWNSEHKTEQHNSSHGTWGKALARIALGQRAKDTDARVKSSMIDGRSTAWTRRRRLGGIWCWHQSGPNTNTMAWLGLHKT